jgi:hypothetical protein
LKVQSTQTTTLFYRPKSTSFSVNQTANMRFTSFLTIGFAAFVMASPVADPAANYEVAESAVEARSVVVANSKIMASDASPVDLVTRQGMSCLILGPS